MDSIRAFVPEWLAWAMIISTVIVLQSVTGMYGVIFQHIVLSNGLDAYDTWMMLRVMLVGTSCFFAIALKLKSLFSPKQAVSLSLAVILACLLVFQRIHSIPAMFAVCIISGFFQMYGTFEALGMLKTPVSEKVNFGFFISFVFLIMLGSADVFGYAKTQLSMLLGKETVLWVTAASLFLSFVLVQVLMKHNKYDVPAVPARVWVFSISELAVLTVLVLSMVLVIFYQQENGWTRWAFNESAFALVAVPAVSLVAFVLLSRISGVSIIEKRSVFFKGAIQIGIIFLFLDFVLSTHNIMQAKLLADSISVHQIRLVDFVGLVLGFLFSIFVFKRGTNHIRLLSCTAFSALLIYAVMMFVATRTGKTTGTIISLSSTIFLGAGQMILFCTFNAYLMDRLQVPLYFSSICVLGILRNCIGMPLGGAITSGILSTLQPGMSVVPIMNRIYVITMLLAIAFLIIILLSHKFIHLKTN